MRLDQIVYRMALIEAHDYYAAIEAKILELFPHGKPRSVEDALSGADPLDILDRDLMWSTLQWELAQDPPRHARWERVLMRWAAKHQGGGTCQD